MAASIQSDFFIPLFSNANVSFMKWYSHSLLFVHWKAMLVIVKRFLKVLHFKIEDCDFRPISIRMFAQLARRAVQSTRNFSTSVARRGEDALPPPGDNLPFSINNRWHYLHLLCHLLIVFSLQIQADCLLHPVLWKRSLCPFLGHETSAPQEINFLLWCFQSLVLYELM